jgi:hypothetical protein
VLLPDATNKHCAFSSCHDANAKKAMLILGDMAGDLNALLAKPSCEAPTFKLVDTSGGDAALAKSWLWIKLTAKTDGSSTDLVPDPAWGTAATCGQPSGFGSRMPFGNPDPLPDAQLNAIKDWICAGAPGKT